MYLSWSFSLENLDEKYLCWPILLPLEQSHRSGKCTSVVVMIQLGVSSYFWSNFYHRGGNLHEKYLGRIFWGGKNLRPGTVVGWFHQNGRFLTTYSLVDHTFVPDVGAILVFSNYWSKFSSFWLKITRNTKFSELQGKVPLLADYHEDKKSWSMYRCGSNPLKKHSFFGLHLNVRLSTAYRQIENHW